MKFFIHKQDDLELEQKESPAFPFQFNYTSTGCRKLIKDNLVVMPKAYLLKLIQLQFCASPENNALI